MSLHREVEDIALSFNQLSISLLNPPSSIVRNVSGYVVKGGITAILGASAIGKSVLMKVLAGRVPQFHVTGKVSLDGVCIDPNNLKNAISYVPQDDFLLGELTPTETLKNVLRMRESPPDESVNAKIEILLRQFGLESVANNMIGTVFVRGLSGGQRKRVEVCSELISPHSVLLLDEPTSGLDGSIAFDVLHSIRRMLDSKDGNLSVILSIHQPNRRILEIGFF